MEKKLRELRERFFEWDNKEITSIFQEFLVGMEAEEGLSPGGLMSRNYDTAQANPEIHTIPGNLKDARDAIFPFFWGTDGWYSSLHLENVKGPANLASLVGALACLLKDPNLCVDTYCLRSNELEVKSITALANLVFYHTESPWGIFTMGGTISNLYGGKLGIEKVLPGAMQTGLGGKRIVGIVSEAGHYSNATLAGWLGIGTDNLVSIPTDSSFAMRVDLLADELDRLYSEGALVAFVIGTMGTTDAFGVDDVTAIRKTIHDAAEKHSVTEPHLHVDAAVGWVSAFLTDYDVESNPLEFPAELKDIVRRTRDLTVGFRSADSVTIDFHKMGWGHYPSSAFIVNRRSDLSRLVRAKEDVPYFSEADYRHDPALFTLECSRPAIGPYTVMASLQAIGLDGYRILIADSFNKARILKERLDELPYCKVLNPDNVGPAVLWWVFPKGRDAKAIYQELLDGKLSDADRSRYFEEIRHLYQKRQERLDAKCDARLSYTTSTGFSPQGHQIPAWKAVFFNPKTDVEVIDNLIESIEGLA
jgi:L-2,4-diaminobutyrate decarboxylase